MCDCLQLAEEKKIASDNTKSLEMEMTATTNKLTQSEGIVLVINWCLVDLLIHLVKILFVKVWLMAFVWLPAAPLLILCHYYKGLAERCDCWHLSSDVSWPLYSVNLLMLWLLHASVYYGLICISHHLTPYLCTFLCSQGGGTSERMWVIEDRERWADNKPLWSY